MVGFYSHNASNTYPDSVVREQHPHCEARFYLQGVQIKMECKKLLELVRDKKISFDDPFVPFRFQICRDRLSKVKYDSKENPVCSSAERTFESIMTALEIVRKEVKYEEERAAKLGRTYQRKKGTLKQSDR